MSSKCKARSMPVDDCIQGTSLQHCFPIPSPTGRGDRVRGSRSRAHREREQRVSSGGKLEYSSAGSSQNERNARLHQQTWIGQGHAVFRSRACPSFPSPSTGEGEDGGKGSKAQGGAGKIENC